MSVSKGFGTSSEMTVQHRYLNLPVKTGAPKRRASLIVNGQKAREFDIELANGDPDFWVFADIAEYQGMRLALSVERLEADAEGLQAIFQSDTIAGSENLYREKLRPQFHFSSRRGWSNDPNGLLYYQGEYHLFYQHNPYGCQWGNMHWGHAVSQDLVHWQELGDALYPDELGTMFSGSGVVDHHNTAGWQSGDEKTLVCIYTSAGEPYTQSIAYSNDRGETWTKYAGNPVVGHIAGQNRDPKVIWHAPTSQWVMALYLDGHDYALLTSADLKRWTRLCTLQVGDATECPDFFELAVDGDPHRTRWVFWGANGSYLLGSFDGQAFTADGQVNNYNWGGDSYAAQTWSDIPAADGRRIQIAWARVNLPGMPFNQFMTFPCELTLRTTPEGIRLFSEPVREIESLRGKRHDWHPATIQPGQNLVPGVESDLLDIRAEFQASDGARWGLSVWDIPIVYDGTHNTLSCEGRTAPLEPVAGRIRLRVLVDRASLEIFGNDGRIAMPIGVLMPGESRSVYIFGGADSVSSSSVEIHELRSAWEGGSLAT